MAHLKILAALSLGGVLATSAFAQTVDVKGATAGETAKTERGVTASGEHTTAGVATSPDMGKEGASGAPPNQVTRIVPKPTPNGGAGSMAPLNGNQSGVAPRANVPTGPGAEAQAVRSSESTARKTIYDPNNQLGTSLQGTTQPVPGANADTEKDAAVAGTASATGAQ